MKTVLFSGLNTAGHLNSLMGIADRLKEEYGYRTVFLLVGPPSGKSIEQHGHELITIEEKVIYEDYEFREEEIDEEEMKREGNVKQKYPGASKYHRLILDIDRNIRHDPENGFIKTYKKFSELLISEIIDNHANFLQAIESIKPDLIILDVFYAPACVVSLKNIPWVRLHSANPIMLVEAVREDGIKPVPYIGAKFMNKQERAKMQQEDPKSWENLLKEWKEKDDVMKERRKPSKALNDFYEKNGVEPLQELQMMGYLSPYINLYLYPQALDYDQDDDLFKYPKNWFRCDSLMRKSISTTDEEEAEFWNSQINKGMIGRSQLVYLSFGSLASGNVELMRRYVNMLKDDSDRFYIVSKGINGDKYELESSNMIGANYVPQTFLLQKVDLAIVHGGNNTITECLYYGVPIIVMPCFGDQLDNAQRVEDLGLGKNLNLYKCTKEELLQAIAEVSSPDVKQKVNSIGRAMQARDDSKKISIILKKLIEEKSLSQEFIEECRYKDANEVEKLVLNSN